MSTRLAVKSIRAKNFKCYNDFAINFFPENGDEVFLLYGAFGPNGSGKTTVLDAISLAFSSFASYTEARLDVALRKYIRNFKFMKPSEQSKSNFLVEADIMSDVGNYTVAIDRHGYLDGKSHPEKIQNEILTQCFRTRYDEELNMFQLRLDRWKIFKDLFETVTGYVVEKKECPMSPFTVNDSSCKASMALLDEYVLELNIIKPNETITDRECSKGEKKILKNFTTLLNKNDIPSIILIDDVEMHVELDRHMNLIRCIERCFPGSQVIFTTHSPKIIYEFDIERMHDLTIQYEIDEKWRKNLIRLLKKISFFCQDEPLKNEVDKLVLDIRSKKDVEKEAILSDIRKILPKFNEQINSELEKV